jgi:hypothetical protein
MFQKRELSQAANYAGHKGLHKRQIAFRDATSCRTLL